MNKGLKWGLLAFTSAAIAGAIYYYTAPNNSGDLKQADKIVKNTNSVSTKKALNVNAVVVTPKTLFDEFLTMGVLIPDEMVNLSFETAGKVVEINFVEGSNVKKGQLLAKVNDAQLQAQLSRLTAQVKLAEDRVFRQKTLLQKDAVSKEALEQVETDLAILKSDIDIIKANISLTELKAPFDGVIGLRQISVGAYTTPTTIVAKLTKTIPLKVEFAVPERYASQMKQGTNLSFMVEGELKSFDSKIYATESTVDPELHQFTVRALYPNAKNELMPGRYTSIRLKKEEISNAIAIPTEAIVPEMGMDKVFLYKSGKAQPTEVTTGLRTESEVQIIKGLSVGDTLIVSGTLQLRTGLDVTLDNIN